MEKTEAIVLHCCKYGDNKIFVNTFTRSNGRMTFAAVIPSSKNKASALPYCQPLFINEIEYSGSNRAEMRRASRIAPSVTFSTIPFSMAKTSVAMFLAEMLSRVLSLSEENEKIYDFIATSLKILDQPEFSGLNFHIKFLVQLAKYLGFYPGNRYSDSKPSFDIAKSMFVEDSAASIHQIRPPYGQIFSRIIDTDFLGCEEMELSGAGRSYLLEKIIEYYAYRFDNMANIRSLEVLKSVFHQ